MADEKYVGKIADFYKKRGRMPTFQEIADMVGFASKNAVTKLVSRLEDSRVLKRDKNGRLVPLSIMGEVRVLGVVEAGFPTEAEESVLDTLSLDEYLVANKQATYMLKVKGDSMKDAGILNGDMVLVERTNNAIIGAIVVASIDGNFTLKYLRSSKKGYYLEPANKSFPLMYPKESLKVEAIVKAVIRRL